MVKQRRFLAGALPICLPLAVLTTIVILLVYVVAQQDLRLGADDPQIQMAEDAAAQLDRGASPASVVPSSNVDMAHSLAPFLIVFDGKGQPLASSASLDGALPRPPFGVFRGVPLGGRNDVTWQPAPRVRDAAVVVAYRDGFVLAGRSLRLIEERESSLRGWVLLAWLASLGLSGLAAVLGVALLGWSSVTRRSTARHE
jgi:hypothetical protein